MRARDRRGASLVSVCLFLCALDGQATTPVDSASRGQNRDVIDRGRYLVKMAGCNDCHTPLYVERAGDVPESKWLVGSALGWQGPWGTTYPINLRHFVSRLSSNEWLQVVRRPPMPWFALRDMTDEDLTAIYSYIRALGPAGEEAPSFVPPGKEVRTPVVRFPSGNEAGAEQQARESLFVFTP
jgi:mono/diheme cytochrome c family protein